MVFDHPWISPLRVRIQSDPGASPGWKDASACRMHQLYKRGMRMWKYVNAVAIQEMRFRAMLEKHVVMRCISPHLNMDTTRHVLSFI